MLDSAVLFIFSPDELAVAEKLFRDRVKDYSTGYLLLPDGETDPEHYCRRRNMQNLRIVKIQDSSNLDHELCNTDITDKSIIIIAVELNIDEDLSKYIDSQLDESLVIPSALYLNGTHTPVNRTQYWRMFKHEGRLTRHGSDEGIMQWGHLLNELSFCLGHSPKYGD